jgi:hypothetical protein
VARTEFPTRARRDDRNGHMVVQQLLEFLRDQFDKFWQGQIRGNSTVPNTATTLVVTHGLGQPTYSVVATPLVDPGVGRWWISNKTATQFQINLTTAAPVGGVPFDWIVKGVYP